MTVFLELGFGVAATAYYLPLVVLITTTKLPEFYHKIDFFSLRNDLILGIQSL